MSSISGRIIKSSGGIYTVETAGGLTQCRARGIFRHKNISPVTGDIVEIEYAGENEPVISDIHERKNYIVRPPLANIDAAVMVISSVEPKPNTFIIDKLTAIFECKDIETIFVFTKQDLDECADLIDIYSKTGYKTFAVDSIAGRGDLNALADFTHGKILAFIGNSGVGKSSLLNCLYPGINIQTGVTSKKLGRGRHTTRHVELFKLPDGTYIADTPGFSTVDADRYIDLKSEDVQHGFHEFKEYSEKCKFADCAHYKEKQCAVREAVQEGKIAKSRYNNYIRIYLEAKEKNLY